MMELILFSLSFLLLLIGSLTDLKWREVPDFISFAGVALGLGINLIRSVFFWDYSFALQSVIGFAFFFALGCLLYYTAQWGGGDAKVLMALGALIGAGWSFNGVFASFIVNVLFVTAIYSLIWLSFLAIMNWKKVSSEARVLVRSFKYFKLTNSILYSFSTLVVILYLLESPFRFVALFALCSALFLFYLSFFIRAIEVCCMQKYINVENLTEGDWIVKDVVIDSKRIAGPKDLGISKDSIRELLRLKKQNKIDTVLIKIGVPLVPSFLLAWILTWIFGNLLVKFI